MASSSASSTDCELTDYDSSSSVEIVVNKKKLNEELKKEMEEDRKIAAEKGLPTYEDGTRQKFDKKGNVRNEQTVRFERFMRKRRAMKVEVMKYVCEHLKRPHVHKGYNYFSRDIPPQHDLNSDLTRKTLRVTADENTLSVTIVRRSPLPY